MLVSGFGPRLVPERLEWVYFSVAITFDFY